MTDRREAMRFAHDAANSAHELERSFLHVAEAVRRGEAPDKLTAGMIPGLIDRLSALYDLIDLPKDSAP